MYQEQNFEKFQSKVNSRFAKTVGAIIPMVGKMYVFSLATFYNIPSKRFKPIWEDYKIMCADDRYLSPTMFL